MTDWFEAWLSSATDETIDEFVERREREDRQRESQRRQADFYGTQVQQAQYAGQWALAQTAMRQAHSEQLRYINRGLGGIPLGGILGYLR